VVNWEQVAVQIPIVAAFIWFVLEMDKRSAMYAHQRDEAWRQFLTDQATAYSESLKAIAEKVAELGQRFETHDEDMRTAIVKMETATALKKPVRKNTKKKR
jgi:hypothetical protein